MNSTKYTVMGAMELYKFIAIYVASYIASYTHAYFNALVKKVFDGSAKSF